MSSINLNSVMRLIYRKGNDDLSLMRSTQTTNISDPTKPVNVSTLDNMQSYQGKYKASDIASGTVQEGDIKLYVDPSTLDNPPENTDKVTDGTTIWNIKHIEKWIEQDTICLYVLQIRE